MQRITATGPKLDVALGWFREHSDRTPGPRYLDAEAAAAYLGIPVKTIRTRAWREREGIPTRKLTGGRLVFDRVALDLRFAS